MSNRFLSIFSIIVYFTLFLSTVAAQPLGQVAPPPGVSSYGVNGLTKFITSILRTLIVIGGVYGLINFILAGFQYMTAGNDPKAVQMAWGRIWQTLIGLVIMTGSFILAGVVGYILTKDVFFILRPQIYGP